MTIIGGVAVLAGLAAGAWAGVSRAGDAGARAERVGGLRERRRLLYIPTTPVSCRRAGHALLFNDTPLKLEPFAAMPSDALTFEAWVSTTDECSKGTLMRCAGVRRGSEGRLARACEGARAFRAARAQLGLRKLPRTFVCASSVALD